MLYASAQVVFNLECQVGKMLLTVKVHSKTKHLVKRLQLFSTGLWSADQQLWVGHQRTAIAMARISAARNSTWACISHACNYSIGLGTHMYCWTDFSTVHHTLDQPPASWLHLHLYQQGRVLQCNKVLAAQRLHSQLALHAAMTSQVPTRMLWLRE